jgi:hypothetical protein
MAYKVCVKMYGEYKSAVVGTVAAFTPTGTYTTKWFEPTRVIK